MSDTRPNVHFGDERLPARFWEKCSQPIGTGCWIWHGAKTQDGYPRFWWETQQLGHRVAFAVLVGPMPSGKQADHLCRTRPCVNPEHLEPVTSKVNTLRGDGPSARASRKTHCPSGHPYSGENLYTRPDGARLCRTCQQSHSRKRWAATALLSQETKP